MVSEIGKDSIDYVTSPASGRKLLIFNPDTDFASGSGSDFYTPPKAALAQAFADPLTACRWGSPGDIVLFPYDMSKDKLEQWREKARDIGFGLTDFRSVKEMNADAREEFWSEIAIIDPWGWNRTICRKFRDAGAPCRLLPSSGWLDELRQLAHRRMTVPFNRFFSERFPVAVPREFVNVEEATEFLERNPGCWFKLPWSSSGRGVVNSAVNSHDHILEWVRGGIRRQGSVLGETCADRVLDFATEWGMSGGQARFMGLSLFEVSSRGQYLGNILRSQEELSTIISSSISFPLQEVVALQKEALEALPLNRYEGFLGIDMMAERDGSVRPCVEINLRRTMGLLNIVSATLNGGK